MTLTDFVFSMNYNQFNDLLTNAFPLKQLILSKKITTLPLVELVERRTEESEVSSPNTRNDSFFLNKKHFITSHQLWWRPMLCTVKYRKFFKTNTKLILIMYLCGIAIMFNFYYVSAILVIMMIR